MKYLSISLLLVFNLCSMCYGQKDSSGHGYCFMPDGSYWVEIPRVTTFKTICLDTANSKNEQWYIGDHDSNDSMLLLNPSKGYMQIKLGHPPLHSDTIWQIKGDGQSSGSNIIWQPFTGSINYSLSIDSTKDTSILFGDLHIPHYPKNKLKRKK